METQTKYYPTEEQIEALKKFANANGRTWKSKLRQAWMSGIYCDYRATDRVDLLLQIRNSFGPTWLDRFTLPKTTVQTPMQLEAAQMKAAFERVGNPTDWRAPIDATVTVSCLEELTLISKAVVFYTATATTFDIIDTPKAGVYVVRVRAIGYRMGPAGA
jgi:hypothetical protein